MSEKTNWTEVVMDDIRKNGVPRYREEKERLVKKYGVSLSTVHRALKLFRENGEPKPEPKPEPKRIGHTVLPSLVSISVGGGCVVSIRDPKTGRLVYTVDLNAEGILPKLPKQKAAGRRLPIGPAVKASTIGLF